MPLLISQAIPYAAAVGPHRTTSVAAATSGGPSDDKPVNPTPRTSTEPTLESQDAANAPSPDSPIAGTTVRPGAHKAPRVSSAQAPSGTSPIPPGAAGGRTATTTATTTGAALTRSARTDLRTPDDDPGWSQAELRAALAASLRTPPPKVGDVGKAGASPSIAPLSRYEDASQAPPPLQQPFEIAFPDSLPQRAPGLAAVLQEREASLMECGMTTAGPGH